MTGIWVGVVAGWERRVGFLLYTQLCLCVFFPPLSLEHTPNQMGTIQTIFTNTNQLWTETVLIKKRQEVNNVIQHSETKLMTAIYSINGG